MKDLYRLKYSIKINNKDEMFEEHGTLFDVAFPLAHSRDYKIIKFEKLIRMEATEEDHQKLINTVESLKDI